MDSVEYLRVAKMSTDPKKIPWTRPILRTQRVENSSSLYAPQQDDFITSLTTVCPLPAQRFSANHRCAVVRSAVYRRDGVYKRPIVHAILFPCLYPGMLSACSGSLHVESHRPTPGGLTHTHDGRHGTGDRQQLYNLLLYTIVRASISRGLDLRS